LKGKEEIEALEKEHFINPGARLLQKTLAEEITIRVHSKEAYDKAVRASEILFGKGTAEELATIEEATLLSAMEGVKQAVISLSELENGIPIIDFLSEKIQLLPSKSEAKKMIIGNGISINKEKNADINTVISSKDLINNRYILAQKGKKDYCLVVVGV
jgi:tyrosyl-tRNA synthetase